MEHQMNELTPEMAAILESKNTIERQEIIEKWLGDGLITFELAQKLWENQTNLSVDEVITMIAKMFKVQPREFLKAEKLQLVYALINSTHGHFNDQFIPPIMTLLTVNDYEEYHTHYCMIISAAWRQRQVKIKDQMFDFLDSLLNAGKTGRRVLISMLEGEYISNKTFKILNNDHHAQYYIDHGFGEMIIPALQRLVKEGTTFCTWTHEGLPVNEVKMKKIEALLEKYQKLQDAAQK